jgi:hypothetical protein
MTNRSIVLAIALAMLVSGGSTSSSFAKGAGAAAGAGAGAAAGAAGAGSSGGSAGPIRVYTKEPSQKSHVIDVKSQARCGGNVGQQASATKCKPEDDAAIFW